MRWLTFLVLVTLGALANAADLKAVRTAVAPDRTRIVFDVSSALEYHIFAMRNPDRLVIDFEDTRARTRLSLPPMGVGWIKAMHHARRGGQGLRLVLDLRRAVRIEDALLPPADGHGYRVALDLISGTARPAPSPPLARPPVVQTAVHAPAAALPPPVAVPAPAARAGRDLIIAIDAGHGGQDVGAIGPSGAYEKDIVLAVARDLASVINRQPGMRAVLTRDGDYFLKLRSRMDRARAHQADLFISVHADAFRDRRVQGSSVYVLSQSGASSEAAKWLADNENASDLIGGVSLDDKDDVLKSVLLDLSQTASIEASIELGREVLGGLKNIGAVHRKGVQHAGFMVLKSPDIPSILVETAFISNPTEEKRLRDPAYRKRLAGAIFNGVANYFDLNPVPATRLADNRKHHVSRGETLTGIANRYDVSISSIKLANNMESETVRAGAWLNIP